STVLSGSASAMSSISGLNTYPIGSLCTLRERRHQRPRNTRYRAARYGPTRTGLAPAGSRQLAWRTNTRYRAARYGLTRAGLPPAGTRQLLLTHHKADYGNWRATGHLEKGD